MRNLALLSLLIGFSSALHWVGNKFDQLANENERLRTHITYLINLPEEREHTTPHAECKPEVQFVEKIVTRSVRVPAPVVHLPQACVTQKTEPAQVKVVTVGAPRAKNLFGFGAGIARTDVEASVNGLNVNLNRKNEPVFSADYTRFFQGDVGIYGQIQTNSTVIVGVRYAY